MASEEQNTTVSFRLPEAAHTALLRNAETAGTTKHQLARTLLIVALNRTEPAREQTAAAPDLESIEEACQAVQTNLTDLRMALGRGVGAILQHVAPGMNKEDIRRWVFERIVSSGTRAGEGGNHG